MNVYLVIIACVFFVLLIAALILILGQVKIPQIVVNTIVVLTAITTMGSIIVSPLVYFRKKSDSEKTERERASSNIYYELEDALKKMDHAKLPKDVRYFETDDGKIVSFMNIFFNHDFYDSLISSGRINFLEHDLQQPIQDIFKIIKKRNEYLELTQKIRLDRPKYFDKQELPKEVHVCYLWINHHEIELSKSIPIIMKELKPNFNIA